MFVPPRWQPTTRNHETHFRDEDGDGAKGKLELQLEWQIRTVRVMGYVNGRWVWREESGLGREEEEGKKKKEKKKEKGWFGKGESHW